MRAGHVFVDKLAMDVGLDWKFRRLRGVKCLRENNPLTMGVDFYFIDESERIVPKILPDVVDGQVASVKYERNFVW